MQIIHAAQALLPEGWVPDVLVGLADDGRIAFVQRRTDLPDRDSVQMDARVEVLLPAPANVHSHAFQRAMAGLSERRGPDPGDSFWSWRKLMYRFLDCLQPDDMEAIAALVQMEMLEAGYACNVEFHYVHHQSGGREYDNPAELSVRIAAAAQDTGIGLTLLPVHYQYGGCDQRALSEAQRRFGTDLSGYARLWDCAGQAVRSLSDDCLIGVAPHSLRAVARESLPELLAMAPGAPFHMHIAEQQAEVLEVHNAWGARPIEWLLHNVAVDSRWCLIHCTQMLAHETTGLARSGAVAGLCPITEASLGDGIFDGVNYLQQQGAIGIGSDSNIRISLSEECRSLEYSQRLRDHSRAALATPEHSTGRRIYDAIVRGGAQAAGRHAGRIEAGAWADLLTLDARHPDLEGVTGDTLLDIFMFAGDDRMVNDVWAAGRHQVSEGRHVNREAIVRRYRQVMKNLRQA